MNFVIYLFIIISLCINYLEARICIQFYHASIKVRINHNFVAVEKLSPKARMGISISHGGGLVGVKAISVSIQSYSFFSFIFFIYLKTLVLIICGPFSPLFITTPKTCSIIPNYYLIPTFYAY